MIIRKVLGDLATVVLVVCALIVTGLVIKREIERGQTNQALTTRRVQGWESLLQTDRFIGPQDAPVKVVEFSDFQCSFCAEASRQLNRLRAAFPSKLMLVYRHFPIEQIHPFAFSAALAAECAAEAGRFEAFHDILFEQQDSIGLKSWQLFAQSAGIVDTAEFQRCVDDEQFRARVEADIEIATRIGVRATPSFVMDSELMVGMASLDKIRERLEALERLDIKFEVQH